MTGDQWQTIFLALGDWWQRPVSREEEDGYRTALPHADVDEVAAALQVLLRRGGRFRPTPAELAGQVARAAEPVALVWEEAYGALFAVGGLLSSTRGDVELLAAAGAVHPQLRAFCDHFGRERLLLAPVLGSDPVALRARDELRWAFQRLQPVWAERAERGLPLTGPRHGQLTTGGAGRAVAELEART